MHARAIVLACAVAAIACVAGCDGGPEDAREGELTAVLAQADEPIIRTRRALAAGKYVRMAGSAVDFLRGSLPLYRHDARAGTSLASVSRFALEVPLVPSIGDPHVENFGALRASDGSLGLEPNDFDAADRAPYLWDLRRLAASMALTALVANDDDPAARARTASAARAVARATVVGYRAEIERAASGVAGSRVTPATLPSNAILADVFSRSERDQAIRRELTDLTELSGASRRLKRGAIDPTDLQNVFVDLPATAQARLPDAVERWRGTLLAPPPAEQFTVLDAVRELGSGVSSWPRVRVVLLVRGATDDPGDDLLLELKELADSGIAGLYPPGVHHDDVGARIVETSRSAWARRDAEPLWGVTTWLGLRCQIRAESQGQKNIRVSRMVGDRGTPEALSELGGVLGGIVARVQTSGALGTEDARAIYARIAEDPEAFADEQADAAVAYAETTVADHLRFRHALADHGLSLGVPYDAADAPRSDFAAVLGIPPPPPPLAP
ncbi:MAG: hypothetical protein JWP87_3247 [Labilithrix sp.]|nr:hypothetical protein [Labilithrix sp.]